MKNVPLAYVEEAIGIAEENGKLDRERLDAFAERMHSAALKKRMGRVLSLAQVKRIDEGA